MFLEVESCLLSMIAAWVSTRSLERGRRRHRLHARGRLEVVGEVQRTGSVASWNWIDRFERTWSRTRWSGLLVVVATQRKCLDSEQMNPGVKEDEEDLE